MDLKRSMIHSHNGILGNRKKEGYLTFATAWMELEIIVLSEISPSMSQLVNDKYHMISLIRGIYRQNKLTSKLEPETWKHETG